MYDSLRVFFVDSKKKFTELYIDIVSEWVYIIRIDTVSECRPRGGARSFARWRKVARAAAKVDRAAAKVDRAVQGSRTVSIRRIVNPVETVMR